MRTIAASGLVRVWVTLLALVALLAAAPARADDDDVKYDISVFPAKIAPGGRGVLVTTFHIEPNWHIYPNKPTAPKELGVEPTPTKVEPAETKGLTFRQGQWPAPIDVIVRYTGKPLKLPAYEGGVTTYQPFTVAADAAAGEIKIPIKVSWGSCDDRICKIPEEVDAEATLTIEAGAAAGDFAQLKGFDVAGFDAAARALPPAPPTPPDDHTKAVDTDASAQVPDVEPMVSASGVVRFEAFGLGFNVDPSGVVGTALIMLVAMLAGFILNLTPCVLPVIPIKIISLQKAAADPARTKLLGLMMSAGVVAFWFALGLLIVAAQTLATTNDLFGNPWFGLGVGAFIAVMAIGMLGAFTMQLPNSVYSLNPRMETAHGSFLFGVVTAILGTPCFGPFAGAAIAWATKQPMWVGISAFTAIGVGMALPYLVLSFKPRWVDFVPRTGPASELVKQVMGLLLLGAAAFFIGTAILSLIAEIPYLSRVLHWWFVAIFCTVAAGWLLLRTVQITPSAAKRGVFGVLAVAIAGGSIWWAVTSTATERLVHTSNEEGSKGIWRQYGHREFNQARAEGKVVVIDFTASWCTNCQALKAGVLTRQAVVEALGDERVVSFEVDITSRTAPGRALLERLGRKDIPLLAVFEPGSKQPIFQSEAYTVAQVLDAVKKAKSATLAAR